MANNIFKTDKPKGFSATDLGSGQGGLADFLVPAGTGAIDVVNEYKWTLTEKESRIETPTAILTEFRLLRSALAGSARYYFTGLAQQAVASENVYLDRMRGYAGLMDFENPTGFWYQLPYFGDVNNEVSSTWATLDILEKIKTAASELGLNATAELGSNVVKGAKVLYEANYPRVGIMDRPKLWEQSTPRSLNIKFPLFNTYNVDDIEKNWNLCHLLLYQNMFNKKDFIVAIPPVFYTVYIPGQFFSIAMYVSDLKVYNRGNMRRYSVGGKMKNIPDVFEIDITLTDMIMPSQNMLAVLQNEQPVTVVARDKETGELKDNLSPKLATAETAIDTLKYKTEYAASYIPGLQNFKLNP